MEVHISEHIPDLPIVIDCNNEKLSGAVMKINTLGLLVEVDRIPFKVGSYVTVTIQLDEKASITERARSIKHYDKFYRKPPRKLKPPEVTTTQPKRLCELHFHMLSETGKAAIAKYYLKLRASKAGR